MIPTGYEVAQLIEETLRLTNIPPDELARRCNLPITAIRRLRHSNEPSSPATLRSLNDGITITINQLSPFEPPTIGFDQEWLTLCQAIKHYLRAMQADTLTPLALSNKPPKKPRRYGADDIPDNRDLRRWKKEMGD